MVNTTGNMDEELRTRYKCICLPKILLKYLKGQRIFKINIVCLIEENRDLIFKVSNVLI